MCWLRCGVSRQMSKQKIKHTIAFAEAWGTFDGARNGGIAPVRYTGEKSNVTHAAQQHGLGGAGFVKVDGEKQLLRVHVNLAVGGLEGLLGTVEPHASNLRTGQRVEWKSAPKTRNTHLKVVRRLVGAFGEDLRDEPHKGQVAGRRVELLPHSGT